MQNILEIKEKMEEQEKVAYGIANARLLEEQEKLQKLFVRKAGYEARLKELTSAKLDIIEIQTCKRASDSVKSMIRDQMIAVHTAQRNLEMARKRLNEVMKERKTHENLKEKAFEAFKEEILAHADDDGSFIEYVIGIEEYVEAFLISGINRSDAT